MTTEDTFNGVGTHSPRSSARPVADLPREPLPAAPPKFVLRAALGLRRLLLRCADAVCPPEIVLLERATSMTYSQQLGVAARLGIADLLSENHGATARELAERTHTDADALHRTLRALATTGIFALDASGRFSNNRLSRALVSDHSTFSRAMVEYFTSGATWTAWADLRRTIDTGRSAFSRVHGKSVWQWFAEHPDEEETFARAMTGFTLLDASQIAALYPFQEITQLCDVGGGRGTLLSELVLRNPSMRGVLYDASGVIISARRVLERRGVSGRVECVAGSFFESVPEGHQAYLLKSVLHDWDDARCQVILSNVRRAIPSDGRLLLVEFILERNDTSSTVANIDTHMMVACDEGRERSRSEFEALLGAAGFRLSRVFEGPTIAVLEALPA